MKLRAYWPASMRPEIIQGYKTSKNQLAAKKLAYGEKVKCFVKRIKDLQDQLAAIGVVVSPEDRARRCIRVLSSKYDGIVTALSSQVRPTPLKFDELRAMLLEDKRKKGRFSICH